MWHSGALSRNQSKNTDLYISSCLFLLRYSEERTGMSPNWDSLFARVQSSRRSFTPRLFWRQNLSQLDRRAYRILESVIVEENSMKSLAPRPGKSLADNENSRGDEIWSHRRGKRMFVWALNKFHAMLTRESFWVKLAHDPARATSQVHVRIPRANL
jgi:hypothetical protein